MKQAGAHTVYIGFGGNVGDSPAIIACARQALAEIDATAAIGHSSLYLSKPHGPVPQNDFVNAVSCYRTYLSADRLLQEMQAIEQALGRRREVHWGPRTIDLDMLLFDAIELNTEQLRLPHPCLAEREFVLYPLFEIAPALTIPGYGRLSTLVDACPPAGLIRLEQEVSV